MAGFDDRKKAAEGKFALDSEKEFKATARRNKLLGLIKQAIDAVAAKEGYDVVLNSGAVAFAKEEHDLSEQVLQQVSKTN